MLYEVITWRKLPGEICCRASPWIISARVWLPVLPPTLAAIGSSAASATTWAMVASNWPMMREAMKAISRLSPSQGQRLRPECQIGANRSYNFV